MRKLLIALFGVCCLSLYGFDQTLDLNPYHDSNKTSIELDYRVFEYDGQAAIVVNPIFKPCPKGDHSFTLGAGLRIPVASTVAGFFLYGDVSNEFGDRHFQMGPSVELLTEKVDYRFNLYLPVRAEKLNGPIYTTSHCHSDFHLVYKMKYAHIGIGPAYNVTRNDLGCDLSVMIPIKDLRLSFDYGISAGYENYGRVALSFAFGGLNRESPYTQAVKRKHGVIVTSEEMNFRYLR